MITSRLFGPAFRAAILVILAILWLIPAESTGSKASCETGFIDRTLELPGRTYKYQVYVPSGYDPSKGWPVILFLHGAGERGSDGLLQTEVGLGSALRRHPDRFPAIVVFPQARAESSWVGAVGEIALLALEKTEREFAIDPDRRVLTGISMGGTGAWHLACQYPDRFAALLVICGRVFPGGASPRPIVFAGGGSIVATLADRVRGMPIWVFHGDADTVVPVEESRQIVTALRALGSEVRYTEIPGGSHNAWDDAFGSMEVAAWMLGKR